MEASFSEFDHVESARRIREILAIPDSAYEERKSIPARDQLTFDNGFYVHCTALFVDIRGSKKLAETHSLPMLARINRTFVSEMTAVLRDHHNVREIFIEGDCVWAVYDTPSTIDIDLAFNRACAAVSFIRTANHYLAKRGATALTIGVGMHYGSALMIKAGPKGSGINEVVWTGKLVGKAAELCSYGNRTYADEPVMVSNDIHLNLNDHNKALLRQNAVRGCYHGNVVLTNMDSWLSEEVRAGR